MAIDTRAKRQAAANIPNLATAHLPVDSASWTWFERGDVGFTYLPASPGGAALPLVYRAKQGVGR